MFARRELYYGEIKVSAMVGGGSNNGVGLFLAEMVLGDGAISARHKGTHSRRLSVRLSESDVDLGGREEGDDLENGALGRVCMPPGML